MQSNRHGDRQDLCQDNGAVDGGHSSDECEREENTKEKCQRAVHLSLSFFVSFFLSLSVAQENFFF